MTVRNAEQKANESSGALTEQQGTGSSRVNESVTNNTVQSQSSQSAVAVVNALVSNPSRTTSLQTFTAAVHRDVQPNRAQSASVGSLPAVVAEPAGEPAENNTSSFQSRVSQQRSDSINLEEKLAGRW